jgi:hypothetical protein
LGDLAFELAEAGRCRAARRLAGRVLARDPGNANAAHAMAHALSEGGAHTSAAAFVAAWLRGYPPEAPEYSHLSWHLAMSELRRGRSGQALAIYHGRLDPSNAPATRLRDAAGLLWSLQLNRSRRPPPALPWGPVRELAARALTPRLEGTDAVHAAMAFAATEDEAGATRLTGGLAARAAAGDRLTGALVLPLVQAILAFGASDYGAARELMAPLVAHLARLGVSNGQGRVIAQTLAAACRRAASDRRWSTVAGGRL